MNTDEWSASTRTMPPKINILGAGIAGLSLAAQLRARKIPYKIFDKATRPHGHNYGLSLQVQAFEDLPTKLEPALKISDFESLVAVDRLVGGTGKLSSSSSPPSSKPTSSSQETHHGLKAQDSALREVLARNLSISRSSRVTSVHAGSRGLQLSFEDGTSSTAPITIDASGEQSPIVSQLLPDVSPEILPYAVYHGSRYIPAPDFAQQYPDLFDEGANIREWSLLSIANSAETGYSVQISRSYIPFTNLPGDIQHRHQDRKQVDEIWVEVRYTISRPAGVPDPIFNPTRTREEAKSIPVAFYTELATLLEIHRSRLPHSLVSFLDDDNVKDDRVLNWLMRVRRLKSHDLKFLAERGVILIGDAAHALPILGSEGACIAMNDANALATWLESISTDERISSLPDNLYQFYESSGLLTMWEVAEARSRTWLMRVHGQTNASSVESRM